MFHRYDMVASADARSGITEVEIIQWFVKPGDRVEQFEKLCEVQSDKATAEVNIHASSQKEDAC